MSGEIWHEARLIPTSGINGAEEQERRATSALLAVIGSVREFGHATTRALGAPKGRIETFIEVPFEHGEKNIYPDGLIRVSRGKRVWTALVEVKTSKNNLEAAQLESYLDIAKEQRFDAVLTISNQIPPAPGVHPTKVDKRKLRTVDLHHWSWTRVLSEAVQEKEHRGVSDPDQAWILGELIRYLEHPRSGAMEFDDMGKHWVAVRDAVVAGTLRPNDKGTADVATRFDALLRFISLQLGRRLGTEVTVALPRKEAADTSLRNQSLVDELVGKSVLHGTVRIPNTVGPLRITADLRAKQIVCDVTVNAPENGRAKTRVNWLVRQLRNAPEDVRIEASVAHQRGRGAAELLSKVRQNPDVLVIDPKKELKSFTVARTHPMGVKRGNGRGSFIESVVDGVDIFYSEIMQNLKAWSPPAPKLRKSPQAEPVEPALASTALSSQDDPLEAEAHKNTDASSQQSTWRTATVEQQPRP